MVFLFFEEQDYFVCDGDVVWEGDYVEFIHIGDKGQRVLDHSQIDLLKTMKVRAKISPCSHFHQIRRLIYLSTQAAVGASQSISSLKKASRPKPEGQERGFLQAGINKDVKGIPHEATSRSWLGHVHRRKLLKSLSNSFTRADW